jgi:hypothetical protein
MNRRFFHAFAILTLLLGAVTVYAQGAGNSGFLDDYSGLEPDPDRAGAWRQINPGVDLSKYTKLMITPIEVMYDPESKHKNISPDEMKAITDSLYGALLSELEPAVPVVGQAGPGVLAVHLAITGVRLENKKRRLLGYTPIGFATTTLANVAGLRVTLESAGLEAELIDSVSGEVVGRLVDRGAATAEISDNTSWEQLNATMKFYAQRFRSRFAAQ